MICSDNKCIISGHKQDCVLNNVYCVKIKSAQWYSTKIKVSKVTRIYVKHM